MPFDPVAALSRLASLAAAAPADLRLQRALRWACREVAAQTSEAAA